MEYHTLLGAEDVSKAGYNMLQAASDMSRAVGNLDDVLFRNQRFMEDWLSKLEQILDAVKS